MQSLIYFYLFRRFDLVSILKSLDQSLLMIMNSSFFVYIHNCKVRDKSEF